MKSELCQVAVEVLCVTVTLQPGTCIEVQHWHVVWRGAVRGMHNRKASASDCTDLASAVLRKLHSLPCVSLLTPLLRACWRP
jgi:hypothetical protein